MHIELISPRIVLGLVALFDYCYKRGVEDAYNEGDSYAAQQFIEEMRANNAYGRFGHNINFDWKGWNALLNLWVNDLIRKEQLRALLNQAQKKYRQSVWCVIPLTFDWYLKGISDYLATPLATISHFLAEPRISVEGAYKYSKRRWKPNDMISQSQYFLVQRAVLDEPLRKSYETLNEQLWSAINLDVIRRMEKRFK